MAAEKIAAIGLFGFWPTRSYRSSTEPPDQNSSSKRSVRALTRRTVSHFSKITAHDQIEARARITITDCTMMSARMNMLAMEKSSLPWFPLTVVSTIFFFVSGSGAGVACASTIPSRNEPSPIAPGSTAGGRRACAAPARLPSRRLATRVRSMGRPTRVGKRLFCGGFQEVYAGQIACTWGLRASRISPGSRAGRPSRSITARRKVMSASSVPSRNRRCPRRRLAPPKA